jgi:hypothetical protein
MMQSCALARGQDKFTLFPRPKEAEKAINVIRQQSPVRVITWEIASLAGGMGTRVNSVFPVGTLECKLASS